MRTIRQISVPGVRPLDCYVASSLGQVLPVASSPMARGRTSGHRVQRGSRISHCTHIHGWATCVLMPVRRSAWPDSLQRGAQGALSGPTRTLVQCEVWSLVVDVLGTHMLQELIRRTDQSGPILPEAMTGQLPFDKPPLVHGRSAKPRPPGFRTGGRWRGFWARCGRWRRGQDGSAEAIGWNGAGVFGVSVVGSGSRRIVLDTVTAIERLQGAGVHVMDGLEPGDLFDGHFDWRLHHEPLQTL